MVYGAEEDEVFTHYGEAIRVSPEDAQIRIEFARAVLELDEDDNSALAQDQLDIALALPAATAFAEVLRGEAAALLESLE